MSFELVKVSIFVWFCIRNTNPINGEDAHLDCSYLDPATCKLEFRAQFEDALRIHVLELIRKLTTQSGEYIQEALKTIPQSEVERREKLVQLVGLYDQSMQEAMEHKNDTRKLFLTISGGSRYKNFSLSKLLGEENAFKLDDKNLRELDHFSDIMGNIWIQLYDSLGDDDKNQFSNYNEITDEVKMMLETEGLVKLELFKKILRKIFKFLNMTDG